MMKRNAMVAWLVGLMLVGTALMGCGEDADDGGSDDGNNTANNAGNNDGGPAHEVDAEIDGGTSDGEVEGESEENIPNQFFAAVAGGELVVFLTSSQGQVINFVADTGFGQIPGNFDVSSDLGEAGFLSVTSPGGVQTGRNGSITVSTCPNPSGTTVTGRFNNITLVNELTGEDDGVLSGSFRATVVNTDGSADCAPPPANNDANNDGGGPSPGPSCSNDTCDGPCCPYLPDLQACNLACIANECMDIANPFGCVECLQGCPEEVGMTEDQACMDAFNALGQCSVRNECEFGDLEDDACLAENCCEEYRATF